MTKHKKRRRSRNPLDPRVAEAARVRKRTAAIKRRQRREPWTPLLWP